MPDIDEFEKARHVINEIEITLINLPRINEVGKKFVLSDGKIPDPIRFVCKGDGGDYAIIFSWAYMMKWEVHIDIMCQFLREEIVSRGIYPNDAKESYIFTTSGIFKL